MGSNTITVEAITFDHCICINTGSYHFVFESELVQQTRVFSTLL